MNLEKAREHFSAYFEGTMEKGLKQSFERTLAQDDRLAAEYRAFEQTMTELGLLKNLTVPHPDDLFEKISARVDRQTWEQNRTTKVPFWQTWFRPLAIGVAMAAIGGLAVLQFTRPPSTSATQMGVLGTSQNDSARLSLKVVSGGLDLSYRGDKQTVVFRDAQGEVQETIRLQSKADSIQNKPLRNQGDQANLLSVVIDNEMPIWIALPGRSSVETAAGEGTLREFARQLAGRYQNPVVLKVKDPEVKATWKLDSEKALDAASAVTQPLSLKTEMSSDGILWIQQD